MPLSILHCTKCITDTFYCRAAIAQHCKSTALRILKKKRKNSTYVVMAPLQPACRLLELRTVMLPCIITAVPLQGPSTAPAPRAQRGSFPAPTVPPADEKPPVVGRQPDGEATAHLRTAVNLSIPPGLAFRVPRLLGSG